eukprot:TRINITY_DN5247_c0_g1_i1.p1 TRINITY_DN5247_c0_g1~~TRINITY_DN5247_c0_g1_i1.p1  ORF type:complete len:303 (-),score=72.43 TRINITY_DN5247_c0_g1_i1:130-999(-)
MAANGASLQQLLNQDVGGVPVIVIAVVSGVSLLITFNAIRYESMSCAKTILIVSTILLEFSVVQLFYPLVQAGTYIFGACQGIQTLAFRVYSIVKSKEIYNLLARHRVINATYGKLFWVSVVSEVIGTIAGIVGFLIVLHFILNNTGSGSGSSAAGTAFLVIGGFFIFIGYIGYLFFLNILRVAGAPRVITRMVWAQIAQFILLPLLAGMTLGAVQFIITNAGTGNTAVVYVYAVVVIYVATKLTSVTMLGYTIWDICCLSKDESMKEYDESSLGSRKGFIHMASRNSS